MTAQADLVRYPQADLVRYQGRYAGSVSRFVAYAIDLVVSSAVFSLALAAISLNLNYSHQNELAVSGRDRRGGIVDQHLRRLQRHRLRGYAATWRRRLAHGARRIRCLRPRRGLEQLRP